MTTDIPTWGVGVCGRCVRHVVFKVGGNRKCPGCGEGFATITPKAVTYERAMEILGELAAKKASHTC